jgi:hypothetical protein
METVMLTQRSRRLSFLAASLTVLFWVGCQDGPTHPLGELDVAELHLSANLAGTNIAALVVEVTAADIPEPLIFNIPIGEGGQASGVITVPAGSGRTIVVRAYDANAIETHRGEVTVNVVAGANPPLTVVLYPLVGDLEIEVEIGDLSVTVEPSQAVLLLGETVQLVATIASSAGGEVNGEVQWGSTQPLVATVDGSGLVTAVGIGEAEIVATFGNVRGSTSIAVTGFWSRFGSSAEGWTSWDNGDEPVQWVTGDVCLGGMGGCISLTDATSDIMAFRAPPELREGADLSVNYGKQLRYWMKVSGGDSWIARSGLWNVTIESDAHGQLSMTFPDAFQVDYPYQWQLVALSLSTAPSTIGGRERVWEIDGHAASEAEIRNVLSNVTNLLITADFMNGGDTAYLDDVKITAWGDEPDGSIWRVCNGLPLMCEMPFDEIVFPGNHNAGSGAGGSLRYCSTNTAASDCFYRNQGKTITEQLAYGIRYFDIDTCICDGVLVTCHGSAGKGLPINNFMNEFNNFLNHAGNRNEVIVITFGDQSPNNLVLKNLIYSALQRWAPTPERLENGDLTIFKKLPGNPWPTLGYLVDTNQRIVVFVRDPSDNLEGMGALSEKGAIHDTWHERGCTSSCSGVVGDTYLECLIAPADKLVLITVNCSSGLCLSNLAGLCDQHIGPSMLACTNARLVATGGGVLGDVTPNFIVADWTQKHGNIVGDVRNFNWQILLQNGFPIGASGGLASDMTLTGIE